jgi:hypothetical protein
MLRQYQQPAMVCNTIRKGKLNCMGNKEANFEQWIQMNLDAGSSFEMLVTI